MSEAQTDYEAAVDLAMSECDVTVTKAYQHMHSQCEQAWYTYCQRIGMVAMPPLQEGLDHEQREGTSAGQHGQRRDTGNGESPAESDDSASAGQGTQEGTDNRAADAESSPDSR